MTLPVFPDLPGRGWDVGRRDKYFTDEARSGSGRVFTNSLWSYPITIYTLTFDYLREDASYQEASALYALFQDVKGRGGRFYYKDPIHNTATAQTIGLGNNSNTLFELGALHWGRLRPIGGINEGDITILVNGSPTVNYDVVDDRIIDLDTAPGSSVPVAWSGMFYQRCKFVEDYLDGEQFAQALLRSGVQFETVKP